MRDTLRIISRQLKEWFPDITVSSTSFNGKYEYGQMYVGELDRDITKQLMSYHYVERSFAILYYMDPLASQSDTLEAFTNVTNKILDFCCHVTPQWHEPYFDVVKNSMTLTFTMKERYYVGYDDIPSMSDAELLYPELKS